MKIICKPALNDAACELLRYAKTALALITISAGFCALPAGAQTPSVTLSDLADYPSGFGSGLGEGLMQASDGNFYFSPTNADYIFRVTPAGVLSTLKGQLDPSCGNGIEGGLIEGPDGYLYGVMASGSTGSATMFKYSITTKTCSLVFNFPSQGESFFTGMTLGSDGNFYGAFKNGGSIGYGYVFRVSPAGSNFLDLYDFGALQGQDDGSSPAYTLIEGTDGNWYGVTSGGGTSGAGVLFQLIPGATTPWQEAQFIDFASPTGNDPVGAPFERADQNIYGLTTYGGPNGQGAVYESDLFDNNPDPEYFGLTNDGAYPGSGGPVIGGDGLVYYEQSTGPGAVYGGVSVVDLDKKTETLLGTFSSSGLNTPSGPFVEGYDGNFYGIAQYGGANSVGGVWKAVPSSAVALPITITASTTAPAAGKPVTLSWTILNVTDKTAAQCYEYQNIQQGGFNVPTTAGGNWTGKVSGTLTGTTLKGSATVTATQSGVFVYAIECQGHFVGLSPAITVSGVAAASTATTLTGSPNPVTYGSQVTFTATVAETSGSNTPTGSVTFAAYGQTLATVNLVNGVAVLKANATGYPANTYAIQATYNGDSADLTSKSNTLNEKLAYGTSTALSVTPSSGTIGTTFKMSATVTQTTGTNENSAKPTGSVTFLADGSPLVTANLSGGTASFSASSTGYPAGTYSITARYNGSSTEAASTSTASMVTLTK